MAAIKSTLTMKHGFLGKRLLELAILAEALQLHELALSLFRDSCRFWHWRFDRQWRWNRIDVWEAP